MVSIRPFEERDNTVMLDIEKLCTQGNENLAMGVDKSPDIIARYKLYDNWQVLVAQEDGKIAGWTGWTVKHDPTKGQQYIYIVEVMVHPDFRRKGIASKLVMEVERNVRELGPTHIYGLILEQNNASKALIEKLGYSKMRELKICGLSVFKKVAQKYKIERISKNEIHDAVSLINEYHSGRKHFVPYTPEIFESYISRIPAYGLENFWVVKENDNIVACAGLWDCSVIQRMCYTKEPFMWKVMRRMFRFLSLFIKMPKIPAEGEYFKMHYIADHAFRKNSPDAMLNLIGHFNNFLFDNKRDFFGTQLDPDDPLFEIIKKYGPQIESVSVYAKAFEKELPEFCSFYSDTRDAIL
ncbi:MAG TPA: GNAT family N-acetyltransferase [Candidatus Methanoperedens sp.]|nr:GNAT family N-acetyltransferase [Candidatus Methanoperedens sp.]HLB70697.1 GNAT family N-acetyltransferase [Candidatus Methanoperedens sp.]